MDAGEALEAQAAEAAEAEPVLEKAELEHLAFEFSTNWEAMRDHPGPKKKAKARRRRRRRQPAEEPAQPWSNH
eukprot:COSAG04_NODE_6086_length_1415_cov_1.192249_3_plen_72_part_01